MKLPLRRQHNLIASNAWSETQNGQNNETETNHPIKNHPDRSPLSNLFHSLPKTLHPNAGPIPKSV